MKSLLNSKNVYAVLATVPSGRVTTYKHIANALGSNAYRAIGRYMKDNPHDKRTYPCHRVVQSDGSIGGYVGGSDKKIKLLETEGIVVKNNKIVNFRDVVFIPSFVE